MYNELVCRRCVVCIALPIEAATITEAKDCGTKGYNTKTTKYKTWLKVNHDTAQPFIYKN